MKRIQTLISTLAGLTMLGVLILVIVLTFQAMSSSGMPGAGALTQPPQGYPPQPTMPIVSRTATLDLPATALVKTQIAEATASAPSPVPALLPTTTPLPGGQVCYVDTLNRFSLMLPPGWRSDPPPPPDALGGVSVLYNYDPDLPELIDNDGNFPAGSLKVQISAGKLDLGQSFDQWLSNLITEYTASTVFTPLTATEPIPYKLGKYEGVSFVFTGQDFSSKNIALPLSDGRVLTISLMPADSSALSDGLSMLSALDASGVGFCTSTPGSP